MEITLEAIISFIGLFVGGGGGAFFTWRYLRRKAKAEAVQAEAEAKEKEQDYYQQLLEDYKSHHEELRSEREHYKNERNELREDMKKMHAEMQSMKKMWTDKEIEMDRKIAHLGKKVEAMRPFLCGDMKCKKRQLVQLSAKEESEAKDDNG